MASKKKRNGRDDFDDDLDFDIPDFGGDNPEAVSKNRKPIATGLKSAASGFGKSFVSEARLRQTLTKSLPKEYEEPISKAFDIKDGVRDLYNNAAKETTEAVRESKRSVNRITRNLEGAIPKKLYDKLLKMSTVEDSGYGGSQSKEEIEQGTIDSAFAGIFAETQKAQADQQKKNDAKQVLQDAIDRKRHSDMTTILGSIDQSLLSMQTYQEKVETNYKKKSLELQFRTYFVQNEMLQLQAKFFQMFKDDLAAITKNTGLPDYVKKAPKEALFEHIREKTFDSIANTISRKRNQWMSGVFKKAGDKFSETLGNIREGASQIFDVAEQGTAMMGSGLGPSGSEIVGDIAGGWAGGKVQNALAARIRKAMLANPKALRFGNKLNQIAGSLPQFVGNELDNGKYADKIPQWLKDILRPDGESSGIRTNRDHDLDRAAQFSDRNSRSLNVVIPELLAKIHHELYVQRTGDASSAPLAYDYEKGKFVTKKEKLQSLSKAIVSDSSVERTKYDMDRIFKEIDPNNTLDAATRKKIAENIYSENKRGTYFNAENMQSARVLGEGDHLGKAQGLVKDFLDKNTHGSGERRLSKLFAGLGERNGDVKDVIQHYIDTGRHGELADLGLLDLKDGRINLDAIRRLELGNAPHIADEGGVPNAIKKKRGLADKFRGMMSGNKSAGPTMIPGGVGDMQEVAKMFRDSIESLNKVQSSGKADDKCCKELKEAIEKASSKTELQEIRDILLRIEQHGMQPGVSLSPEAFAEWMKQQGASTFGKAGNFAKGAFGKLKNLFVGGAKGSWNASMKTGKAISGAIFGGASKFGSWMGKQKDKFDLYIDGEIKPRLEKYKLDNGRYMNVETGTIITKFSDITGDVKDLDTGEIVLRLSDLKNAVLRNVETGKAQWAKLTDWGKKGIAKSFQAMKDSAKAFFGISSKVSGFVNKTLKQAYEHLTDGPMDVYLKDQYETPVLLKRLMSQGLYFDKESLDPITKVSQIKGPVVDNQENVLITKEDLHNGLYDKNGREIRTGFDRVMQFVGMSFQKTIGTYKKILGKAKDIGSRAMGWLKGLFGFDSPFTVFSKTTNDILGAIYNLLNDRLPGERSAELDTMMKRYDSGSGKSGGGVAGAGKRIMDKLRGVKDTALGRSKEALENAKAYKDEHWDKASDEVRGRLNRGKNAVVDGLHAVVDTLRERLPEAKKKVFGDTDGDGVREGSIDDIRSKREKLKDKAADLAKAGGSKMKEGGKGLLATLAGLFGKNKDGEDGDEKDSGDININGGGDKGEKGNKPRGRIGRAWDKLKGKLTPKGSGIGARAARFGGRLLGGLGKGLFSVGKFGLGALLGGGLLSAETLMGGLSLVGSALGMAGTALGAIISSPITVPALALAAAGTGAYFAYKWLTKPDPQPIEKVRLVQYGWKSNDIEAYKKMKTLESKVASAVTFKGEKAEFDSTKLNIQDMMKVYDLDPKNQDHAKKFVDWFANRFRPIYLNHKALIKIQNPGKELENIDDAKPEAKQKYLDQCLFPGDWYSTGTSPFKDQAYTFTSQGSAERQIKIAKAEIEKESSKKPEAVTGDIALNTAAQLEAAKKIADAKKDLNKEQKQDEKDRAKGVPGKFGASGEKLAEMNRLRAATSGSQAFGGPGNNPINGPAGPGGISSQGNAQFDAGGMNIKQPGNGTGGDINSIPIPKGSGNWAALKDTILASAKMVGVDPKVAAAITAVESNFRVDARPMDKSGKLFSSAKGLNQFIDGTWRTMMSKYAKKYGIDPNTSPMDPRANALMGAEFIKENMEGLKGAVKGRPLTATDAYIAHFMGLGGARKFLSSDPNATGASVFPDAAKANPWIFYDKGTNQPKTLAQIYGDFTKKLSGHLQRAGFSEADLAGVGADPQKTKDDNAKIQAAAESTGPGGIPANTAGPASSGTVQQGTAVASPKPTMPNKAPSLADNPNTGPLPAAQVTAGPSTASAQIVSSPRPSYDPSSGGSTAPVTRASAQDDYYKKQSSINTGDVGSILKETQKTQQDQLTALNKIVDLLEKQPQQLASMLSEVLGDQTTQKTASTGESNNYGKGPAKPVSQPSMAFRRQLAGQ